MLVLARTQTLVIWLRVRLALVSVSAFSSSLKVFISALCTLLALLHLYLWFISGFFCVPLSPLSFLVSLSPLHVKPVQTQMKHALTHTHMHAHTQSLLIQT